MFELLNCEKQYMTVSHSILTPLSVLRFKPKLKTVAEIILEWKQEQRQQGWVLELETIWIPGKNKTKSSSANKSPADRHAFAMSRRFGVLCLFLQTLGTHASQYAARAWNKHKQPFVNEWWMGRSWRPNINGALFEPKCSHFIFAPNQVYTKCWRDLGQSRTDWKWIGSIGFCCVLSQIVRFVANAQLASRMLKRNARISHSKLFTLRNWQTITLSGWFRNPIQTGKVETSVYIFQRKRGPQKSSAYALVCSEKIAKYSTWQLWYCTLFIELHEFVCSSSLNQTEFLMGSRLMVKDLTLGQTSSSEIIDTLVLKSREISHGELFAWTWWPRLLRWQMAIWLM